MLDFLYELKKTTKNTSYCQPSWFAYVSPDDPICDGVELPDNAEKVRLIGYEDIPMFALFYQKELAPVDPYEALLLLSEGRLTFNSLDDKEMFVKQLSENLNAYDRANEKLDAATHAAFKAGIIGGVIASITVVVVSLVSRRSHK